MTDQLESDRGPNPVDRHVGLRIRMRRKEKGLSQERLAESVDLTFQQIQKYERAANRVSASKLWEIARALETPLSYFFEGLPETGAPGADRAGLMQDFLLSAEGLELMANFPRIHDPRVRRKVLDLVRAMANSPEDVEA